MANPVVHFEINGAAKDTVKFYSELFGWNIQTVPMGDGDEYNLVDTAGGQGINGGITEAGDHPAHITVVIEVDDVAAYLDKVRGNGGQVVVERTELPMVTFGNFTDPAGNLVGLVESDDEEGPGISQGSGSPITWFEILGGEGDQLIKWYEEVFDWDLPNIGTDEMPYHAVSFEKPQIAGGVGPNPQGSSLVTIYAQVPDINATLKKAEELGAKTLQEELQVMETTKIGAFQDPQGRTFGLFTSVNS